MCCSLVPTYGRVAEALAEDFVLPMVFYQNSQRGVFLLEVFKYFKASKINQTLNLWYVFSLVCVFCCAFSYAVHICFAYGLLWLFGDGKAMRLVFFKRLECAA